MLPASPQLVRSFWEEPGDLLRRELGRLLTTPNNTEDDLVAKYPADIREDSDAYYVDAEMPGFAKGEIDVSLEDNTLNITAQRKCQEKKGEHHLRERRFTKVARSFRLPASVDESKVAAKLDHGVLHLTLPKQEEVKPRRINVV